MWPDLKQENEQLKIVTLSMKQDNNALKVAVAKQQSDDENTRQSCVVGELELPPLPA